MTSYDFGPIFLSKATLSCPPVRFGHPGRRKCCPGWLAVVARPTPPLGKGINFGAISRVASGSVGYQCDLCAGCRGRSGQFAQRQRGGNEEQKGAGKSREKLLRAKGECDDGHWRNEGGWSMVDQRFVQKTDQPVKVYQFFDSISSVRRILQNIS